MKLKIRNMNTKLIIMFFCFILLFPPIFAQKKFDASLGFGLLEFAFLKLIYGENIKIGLSY